MVTGLYKKFGDKIAVNNLNLTVPRGSIFGIVGPNGAGKTTMLNMATGLLRPDAGQAIICGFDMWHDPIPAKAAMGLLADGLPVFDRLTGEEYLQYLGALRGIPEADLAPRISELLHALGLEEATDKYIADYSAGMTKKILLAGALIHNPDVLILDEPLEAVDPAYGIAEEDRPGIVVGAYQEDDPKSTWVRANAIGMPVVGDANYTAAMTVL